MLSFEKLLLRVEQYNSKSKDSTEQRGNLIALAKILTGQKLAKDDLDALRRIKIEYALRASYKPAHRNVGPPPRDLREDARRSLVAVSLEGPEPF